MQPRWLTWLFILALGYMIYSVGQQHREAPVATPAAAPATADTDSKKAQAALAEFTDAESWKRKLNPDYAASHDCSNPTGKEDALALKIIEDAAGGGDGATCGTPLTLALTVWGANGNKAYHGEIPLALGSRQIAAGLDYGLLGIKPAGTRTLVLPPAALTRNAKNPGPAAVLKALPQGKLAVVTVTRVK